MDFRAEEYGDFEKEEAELLALAGEEDWPLPPPHLFDRIIRNLEIKRGKRKAADLAGKLGSVFAVAVILSTSLHLLFPGQALEGGRRLADTFTYLMEGSIRIEEPSIPRALYAAFEDEALEDFYRIRDKIPKDFRLPSHVPPGFRVRALEYSPEDGILHLYFQGEGGGFVFSQGKGKFDGAPVGKIRPVSVQGIPGQIQALEQGGFRVVICDGKGECFLLEGDLEEKELLKTATSLY